MKLMPAVVMPQPNPDLDSDTLLGEFSEGSRLVGSRCEDCGTVMLGARVACSTCVGRALARVPLSTTGTLYTFTRLHTGDGVRVLGYVDLDSGVRTLSNIREDSPLHPGVRVGLEVAALDWWFAPLEEGAMR